MSEKLANINDASENIDDTYKEHEKYDVNKNVNWCNFKEDDNDVKFLSNDSLDDIKNVNEPAEISADENSHNTTQSPQIIQNTQQNDHTLTEINDINNNDYDQINDTNIEPRRSAKERQQVINYEPSLKGQKYESKTNLFTQQTKNNKMNYTLEDAMVMAIIIDYIQNKVTIYKDHQDNFVITYNLT